MSLLKRIVPCLDIRDGRVVKGVNFVALRDAGDPVELARRYEEEGADELVFLDITATVEGRRASLEMLERIAAELTIPFSVGGGIRSVADVRDLLHAGCDKVAVNSSAVRRPELLDEIAQEFGRQSLVVAIDVRCSASGRSEVFLDGGRTNSGREAVAWATEAASRGAGELLLTSMDRDGTQSGFDIELCTRVHDAVSVPVIASGGAGSIEDFVSLFASGSAEAALGATVFHFGSIAIPALKAELLHRGIEVRP
ncbi:MAG TPA: imidazole glycerol phosphate synthase subunit HisF [Candidatus Dormibacteraeota bacterium]|nr:imidazole glycerol phosphate synthase subunit HisF [Candidatus Dormibacteraeota bacterium]